MLTKERLLEVLEFDESISRFRWKEREGRRTFNTRFAGSLAGWVHGGGAPGLFYRTLRVDGVRYQEHRLVWLYWNGELPKANLDHLNGDGLDNRLENLRLDADRTNERNMAKNACNTSGYSNVCWHKATQKWWVRVHSKTGDVSGGLFNDIEEAALKAKELREKLGFSPLHGLTREERKASSELAE